MKRVLLLALVALTAIWCGQCGDSSTNGDKDRFDLTMVFSRMAPDTGHAMFLRVMKITGTDTLNRDTVQVAERTVASVTDSFQVVFHDLLDENTLYNVDFFVDKNDNGRYNAPSTDPSWRVVLDDVGKDTVVHFVRNTNFTNIHFPQPALFNLTVQPRGMDTLIGKEFRISVIDTINGDTLADTTIASLDTANFDVVFDTVLVKGRTTRVDVWGDLNENGTVQAPPADQSWRVIVPNATAHKTVTIQHSLAMTSLLLAGLDAKTIDLRFLNFAEQVNRFIGRQFASLAGTSVRTEGL